MWKIQVRTKDAPWWVWKDLHPVVDSTWKTRRLAMADCRELRISNPNDFFRAVKLERKED